MIVRDSTRNIGMPDNLLYNFLSRKRNYAQHRIKSQEKQQPTALRRDATYLAKNRQHTSLPGWLLSGLGGQ